MKNYKLVYNEYGYLAEPIQTDEYYIAHQENDSVSISATFPGILTGSVKAYVEFPGGGDIIECEKLAVNNHTATAILSSDHLRYHYLLVGFEVDTGTKQIRFEPVTLEVDKFVNPTGSASPSVYTVTVKIGNVTELEPGETPTVTNSGTDKNPVFDFGIPRGYKGDTGEAGYSPVKGVDYFTDEDIESLGIGDKAEKTELPTKLSQLTDDITEQSYNSTSTKPQSGMAVAEAIAKLLGSAPENLDTLEELAKALNEDENFSATVLAEIAKKVDKVDGKGLSSNDFTDEFKEKVENNTFEFVTIFDDYDIPWQECEWFNNFSNNPMDYLENSFFVIRYYCSDGVYYYLQFKIDGGLEYQIARQTVIDENGEVYQRLITDENTNWADVSWQKISVSQTDLDNAIGDIETSLENIITKYGLGGDSV